MEDRLTRIAITHGDTNGIGYEIIFKTFHNPTMLEICTPIIYGSPKVATYHRKMLDINTPFSIINKAEDARDGRVNLLAAMEEEMKIEAGRPSQEAGKAALLALDRAMNDYKAGLYDALVTAPINKQNIQDAGFNFPGHTEYLENKIGQGAKALMILMSENLKVALATTHLPLKDVPKAITKQAIEDKARILFLSLKRDLRVDNPRIAVLSLNPHGGDGGHIGTEENTIIEPVIDKLSNEGMSIFGPYSADGFFGSGNYAYFDAILAMYHDQGLAPFKALAQGEGVNFTAGLPLVRTSPGHGTAYDIAGKGVANEASFRQAVYSAIDIWRNRMCYDEPFKNPLPKLYQEKHDEEERNYFDPEYKKTSQRNTIKQQHGDQQNDNVE